MNNHPKAQEWRASWPLPLVALVGMAGSGITVYSTGVFMGEVTREFGWSKTQYTSSMSIQLLITLFLIPLVGRAVDRFGPRRVALAGLLPTIAGTSALGLANGQLWQWWLLAGIQTVGAVMIVPPVWITAVVGMFHASRGLALAVALAGIGAGTALWPMLAAQYIDLFGWRLAYTAMALSWGAIIIPLTIFCFHGRGDRLTRRDRPAHLAVPYRHHLKSPTFLALAGAGGLFVLTCHAMTLHLVPILRSAGFGLGTAAALAGVTGASSIFGRLATGVLLDMMPARRLGVIVFLLPVTVALMLAYLSGSFPLAVVAVAILGLSMGAEGDILNYIASRRFDHAIFGSIASILQTVTAVTSVTGVMLAGALTDLSGSYRLFLLISIPIAVLGAFVLAMVPDEPAMRSDDDEDVIGGFIPMTNQPLVDAT